MNINLEILNASYIFDENEIAELKTKELVPKMVQRRRLTRASKIAIYLANEVEFDNGRIVYGSSFGEIPATANILNSIKEEESISPTHFQNSVYNTAVSYLSMLTNNKSEILTISSGDKTSSQVLKAGAIKALDGDTLLLLGTETFNIPNIEEVNSCKNNLECGVALKVKVTEMSPTLDINLEEQIDKIPNSLSSMFNIAMKFDKSKQNIIKIEI